MEPNIGKANAAKKKKKKEFGLIDRIINKLPEIHIPSYQYAGPGTKLEKRLARGDPGKNKLDVACKHHDIAYATCANSKSRRKADRVLIDQALRRIYARDAKLDERAAALLVSALMTTKVGLSKIGLGLDTVDMSKKTKSRGKRSKKRESITFTKLIRGAKANIRSTKLNHSDDASLNGTIKAAIRNVKDMKRGKTVKVPRVLKLPKFGASVQSILPILSGLSAIGSITASAVGVRKALKEIEVAKKQLAEGNQQPHLNGERKIGRGLKLLYKSNAKGAGFYLKPYRQR